MEEMFFGAQGFPFGGIRFSQRENDPRASFLLILLAWHRRGALLSPPAPRQRGHGDAVLLLGEEKPRVHTGTGWDSSDGRPPPLSRDTAVPSPDLPVCGGLLNTHTHRGSSLNTKPREAASEAPWRNTPIFLPNESHRVDAEFACQALVTLPQDRRAPARRSTAARSKPHGLPSKTPPVF